MSKKINVHLVIFIILALADEVIILAIILFVLWLFGIEIPVWFIITLSLLLLVITSIAYFALSKNPQLGFENMIGKNGLAIEPINHKGTVKIKGKLWFARTKDKKIKAGAEIVVVEQTGLKLTIIEKTNDNLKLIDNDEAFLQDQMNTERASNKKTDD